MPDLDFNRHPIEKLCIKKLTQAGLVPQADKPYSLQLLAWTLDRHPNAVAGPAREYVKQLFDAATQMFQWDVKTVQSRLFGETSWPKENVKQLEDWVPENVGAVIADSLYANLRESGQL